MLIEFSVSNFRSISKKVTFSTVASAAAAKRSGVSIKTGSSIAPNILTTAMILGPNASGKSSIVDALKFFLNFVASSSRDGFSNGGIKIEKNIFVSDFKDKPSEFELIFHAFDTVYQFGFSVDHNRVVEEWLYAKANNSKGKPRTLIQRGVNPLEAQISETVSGEREVWKKSTRENALLFSTAAQLNAELFSKLHSWLWDNIHAGKPSEFSFQNSAQLLYDGDSELNEQFDNFFADLDLHLSGVSVEKADFEFPVDLEKMLTKEGIKSLKMNSSTFFKVKGKHLDNNGEIVALDFSKESEGTRALFNFSGPILEALNRGGVLFVDELNTSLHPCALKGILAYFQNPKINKHGAQLIFTTHETSVIDDQSLHKDQIWFVERADGLTTTLTPLSDYNVVDLRAFQKKYLNGTFGAIPMLGTV